MAGCQRPSRRSQQPRLGKAQRRAPLSTGSERQPHSELGLRRARYVQRQVCNERQGTRLGHSVAVAGRLGVMCSRSCRSSGAAFGPALGFCHSVSCRDCRLDLRINQADHTGEHTATQHTATATHSHSYTLPHAATATNSHSHNTPATYDIVRIHRLLLRGAISGHAYQPCGQRGRRHQRVGSACERRAARD